MPPPALIVTPAHARRFLLCTLGLTTPFPDVASALTHHGFVQLDPINVCGRVHDLILRNRVAAYREGDLLRHLHGDATGAAKLLDPLQRRAFEHYFDVLAALPLDAWPYLVPSMRARAARTQGWASKLSRDEERLARRILAIIERDGALSSDEIEHDSRATTAWNSPARFAKVVLEKLFLHGRVLITTRRTFRRVYDLPERVLPTTLLTQPSPPADEVRRWEILTRLRQRRLVKLGRVDVGVVADHVQPVRIDSGALVYCLRDDVAWFDLTANAQPAESDPPPPRLLAPLDPVIYDRDLARRIWDFDYTWEVYTPPAKRVRGYYALPVLAGEAVVGHVDPKADRERRRLLVMARSVKRGVSTAAAVGELARFLGLK